MATACYCTSWLVLLLSAARRFWIVKKIIYMFFEGNIKPKEIHLGSFMQLISSALIERAEKRWHHSCNLKKKFFNFFFISAMSCFNLSTAYLAYGCFTILPSCMAIILMVIWGGVLVGTLVFVRSPTLDHLFKIIPFPQN